MTNVDAVEVHEPEYTPEPGTGRHDVLVDDRPVVTEVVRQRSISIAAVLGLVLGLLALVAFLLLNVAVGSWVGSAEVVVQVALIFTAIFGLLFSMIGLGQRRYGGRLFAVLGLLFSVVGLVSAQFFWAYATGVVMTGSF